MHCPQGWPILLSLSSLWQFAWRWSSLRSGWLESLCGLWLILLEWLVRSFVWMQWRLIKVSELVVGRLFIPPTLGRHVGSLWSSRVRIAPGSMFEENLVVGCHIGSHFVWTGIWMAFQARPVGSLRLHRQFFQCSPHRQVSLGEVPC